MKCKGCGHDLPSFFKGEWCSATCVMSTGPLGTIYELREEMDRLMKQARGPRPGVLGMTAEEIAEDFRA